ncbi:hypothetical protein K491DRAFT_693070 [Lophiostoma macrostomum CBS 122681]|uniref:Enoyl reductase (ER) domain-containing protein n=1 Tax=Lophiostoma macrostomum CBS 122681 TaxID=1314788 RepID=A0A6A6T5M3_9PLEO|nr:hypothetical protein K491DRAFT_693070 [Lophiostoma macrostomum CBS 122681]
MVNGDSVVARWRDSFTLKSEGTASDGADLCSGGMVPREMQRGIKKINKPIPTPGPTQVVVKLSAASLNFRDLLIAIGGPYPGNHVPGLILAADGAGSIFLAGSESSWRGKEGTAVVLHPNEWLSGDVRNLEMSKILGGYSLDGTLQQFVLVNDTLAIPAPKGMTGAQAASLPTAGVTAWSAIREALDARFDGVVDAWKGKWTDRRLEGKYVLTQGTGGVSCFAIQIASALGATVISTSSSDAKLAIVKQLGARHVINYRTTPDWDQDVLRLTEGKGVDHVVEVGGAATIQKSVNCTRKGGLVSVIGVLSEADVLPPEFVPAVLFGGKIVKGCVAFSREATAEFCEFAEAHSLQPLIAQTFEFDETVEAFETLQKQNAVGKLVVKISE